MPYPATDLSGIIPTTVSQQIFGDVTEQSVVLRLARREPMPTKSAVLPVLAGLPKAGWVSVAGGRKPLTDFKFQPIELRAEELAAVIALPDEFIDDSQIPIWSYARPKLAEAIAVGLDDAVLWGVDAPASFPAGGVLADAVTVAPAADALSTVNKTMAAVEMSGLPVSGAVADLPVRGALRALQDAQGGLVLGPTAIDSNGVARLFDSPIIYMSFDPAADPDYLCGDWDQLIIGVRQDIRYQMSQDGVLLGEDGSVVLSAFQDNTTLMKIWARFACALIHPVTRRQPEGAHPFACTNVVGVAAGPQPEPETRRPAKSTGTSTGAR